MGKIEMQIQRVVGKEFLATPLYSYTNIHSLNLCCLFHATILLDGNGSIGSEAYFNKKMWIEFTWDEELKGA